MRLSRVLPALGLLFGARASQLVSRAPHAVDAGDVCASLNTELVVPDLLGVPTAVGVIDACLCLSGIPLFLETNVVAILAATVAGEQVVIDILTGLVNDAAPSGNCVYPKHSTPACVNGSPCGFVCADGFTPFPADKPKECRCKGEHVEVCNDKCVAKGACPTHRMHHDYDDRRRWVSSSSCAEKGHGWLACGVYGGGPRAWECVNSERDLESCGGCVVPLTAYSPKGKDCTAIPSIADVACEYGECVVRRCLHGLVPSHDGTSCVPEDSHHHHHHDSFEAEVEEGSELVPAGAYGLEHVPLQRN